MTKSKLYKITAWRDNAVKIVLVQNEGSNADNPTYNKTIQFRLTESGDQLLTVPGSAEIVLAIEKPDHSTDLISGYIPRSALTAASAPFQSEQGFCSVRLPQTRPRRF